SRSDGCRVNSLCVGSLVLAIRVAWLVGRWGRHSDACLFTLGSALFATDCRDRRITGNRGAGYLSASRKHWQAGARRRAKILVQQKTRRSVKRIAILGAGSWGTALALVLTRSRQPHE